MRIVCKHFLKIRLNLVKNTMVFKKIVMKCPKCKKHVWKGQPGRLLNYKIFKWCFFIITIIDLNNDVIGQNHQKTSCKMLL